MKHLKWTVISLALVPALLYAGDRIHVEEQYLLAKRRAGLIEIGMTVDDLLMRFNRSDIKLVDLNLLGKFTPAIEIYLGGTARRSIASVTAEIGWRKEFNVTRITVYDARFRTDRGIGVGSTLGDIKKSYKISRVTSAGSNLVAVVGKLRMDFILKLDLASIPQQFFKTGGLYLLPDNLEVVSIIVN